MKRVITVDRIEHNIDGSIHVYFSIDGAEPVLKTYPDLVHIVNDGEPCPDQETAWRYLVCGWLAADPTAQDEALLTDFKVEVDYSALIPVRRVLVI